LSFFFSLVVQKPAAATYAMPTRSITKAATRLEHQPILPNVYSCRVPDVSFAYS
jgi:hypothetical protein